MNAIKAIETVYHGYKFRSRLEARWAVFFDTLGIKYEYEKEGYDLDGIWYLPDFWLPEQGCWVEIKGQKPTEEENEKASKLAFGANKTTFILWGDFQPYWYEMVELMPLEESKRIFNETGTYVSWTEPKYHGQLGHRFRPVNGTVQWSDTFHFFSECPLCDRIEIVLHGLWSALSCDCHKHYYTETRPEILKQGLGMMALFHETEEERRKNLANGMEEIKKEAHSKHCHNSERLIAAYTAARQARFEHGERP